MRPEHRKRRRKKLWFGVNALAGDWTVREGGPDGPAYTIEEARRAWEAGDVVNYTRPFLRLVELGWDMDALRAEFWAEMAAFAEEIRPAVEVLGEYVGELRRREAERN